MEKAALQKILETEKKADEIIAEGIKTARATSEKSTAKIKRLRVEYEELLDREVKQIINQKIKDAEAEIDRLEVSFTSECDIIREEASVNITKAVEYVIEKIGDGKWQ